jgi:hypothetical protein
VIAWVHKGYKCHHLPFNMVYTSRGVIFNENVFPLSILPFLDSPSNSTNLHVAIDQFEDYVHAPSALHNHGTCTGAWLELLKELQLLSISSPKLPTLSKSRDHVNHGCVPPMKLHGPSLPLGHERWIIMHMCMLVGLCACPLACECPLACACAIICLAWSCGTLSLHGSPALCQTDWPASSTCLTPASSPASNVAAPDPPRSEQLILHLVEPLSQDSLRLVTHGLWGVHQVKQQT